MTESQKAVNEPTPEQEEKVATMETQETKGQLKPNYWFLHAYVFCLGIGVL